MDVKDGNGDQDGCQNQHYDEQRSHDQGPPVIIAALQVILVRRPLSARATIKAHSTHLLPTRPYGIMLLIRYLLFALSLGCFLSRLRIEPQRGTPDAGNFRVPVQD